MEPIGKSIPECLGAGREAVSLHPSNPGLHVFNASKLDVSGPRTIVITGTGRSGTTATARVLQAAGMAKVGQRRFRTQDDYLFGPLMEANDPKFLEYAKELDSKHDVWGFKWHLAWKEPIVTKLRNPIMVMLFRDCLTISQRAEISAIAIYRQSIEEWMRHVAERQFELASFCVNQKAMPIVAVSYEKMLTRPETVRALVETLGLQYSDDVQSEIVLNDHRYLRHEYPPFEGPGQTTEWE
jgi:hypothetical protein